MAGRESVFGNPAVVDLASHAFVPVAENCSPLQTQPDAKGQFFRLVAEQGHYAGRTFPTGTRQGYYAFTPDGRLLTAMNSRDPRAIEGMLRLALQRWEALTSVDGAVVTGAPGALFAHADGDGSHASGAQVGDYAPARPNRYPDGGLVLRLAARDLPREADSRPDDWRKRAWNLDYAWFTRAEAEQLVPVPAAVGATRDWPRSVVRRLALFHLRDFVRGEPAAWPEEALRQGQVTSTVTAADGDRVTLRVAGHIRLQYLMRWRRPNDGQTVESDCGYVAALSGEAVWDRAQGRFIAFDVVAAGPRQGANQYNNRFDDLGPAPMGIAMSLAGDAPKDRTPPHQSGHRAYWEPLP